jgi:hypothetical protein
MVQLDAEAQEGLAAALKDMDTAESDQPVEQYTEEVETYDEEAEFEEGDYEEQYAEEGEEYEEYEDDETDVEEGHSVPYNRFSKVIAAKNSAAAEAGELREQIEQMQYQMDMMKNMRQMMGQGDPEETSAQEESPYDTSTEMGRMQAQMHEISVQQEQSMLEQEIAQAQNEYPGIDSNVLLNAVIQDPAVDIMAVAEQYTNHVAEIEEAAISNFLANLDLEEADEEYEEDLPPEVGYTNARQRTMSSAAGNKPQSMEQAHAALADWLSNN